jgi:lyso-ornithine lipid O-acyltransferase
MTYIRLFRRGLFALFVTIGTVALIWVRRRLMGRGQADALRVRRGWARALTWGIGMRIERTGTPPGMPCLLVANHRAALDPILLMTDVLAVPVSRAEVASWPILGRGAELTGGILYVQRDDGGSRLATLRAMADTIQNKGWSVVLFPEGNVSAEVEMLPFLPGAFMLAARLGLPVVPVTLIYESAADYWIGNESFVAHAMRSFGKARVPVKVVYGEPITGTDGRANCAAAEAWCRSVLRSSNKK